MHFTPNTIYHIYNQGNNRQPIFHTEANYLFFLKKMEEFILPYGDLLCYCLMPNHFHWLVYVREVSVQVAPKGSRSSKRSEPATRTLNDSIGILLRSYTRAIHKQEGTSGSIFRQETKAKDGWENPSLTPFHPDYGKVLRNWERYGRNCFFYIHNNPVEALLTLRPEDWEYSSAKDYAGLRNDTLCNLELARKLLYL
jgi:putative transposase